MASDEKPAKSTGRPLGPTGETVRANIKRIRENQRIAVTELSAKMRELGRPIPTLGIHRIEDGQRRVDVDDLVAFAMALSVSPATLLMPDVDTAQDEVVFTGHPDPVSADRAWAWFGDAFPINLQEEPEKQAAFIVNSWPTWRARALADTMMKEAQTWQEQQGLSVPQKDIDGDN